MYIYASTVCNASCATLLWKQGLGVSNFQKAGRRTGHHEITRVVIAGNVNDGCHTQKAETACSSTANSYSVILGQLQFNFFVWTI